MKLLGIVSAYDLIKELKNVKTVDELMLPAEPFLLDSATAKDAIITIDEAPFGIIPIVDNDHKVVGLVTRGTLLSACPVNGRKRRKIQMNNLNIWEQLVEQIQIRWGEVLSATSLILNSYSFLC